MKAPRTKQLWTLSMYHPNFGARVTAIEAMTSELAIQQAEKTWGSRRAVQYTVEGFARHGKIRNLKTGEVRKVLLHGVTQGYIYTISYDQYCTYSTMQWQVLYEDQGE